MSLDKFILDPFRSSSDIYNNSFLKMSPAPEYANGEVILAALYRKVGFQSIKVGGNVSEKDVPKNGRNFQKELQLEARENNRISPSGLPREIWRRIIEGTLRSPLQSNQSTRKYLQLSPIVPDTCIYSLSARQSANSWDPGELLVRILQFSGLQETEVEQIWQEIFNALTVNSSDDIWAQFLQKEFESWRPENLSTAWEPPPPLKMSPHILLWHKSGVKTPATRFVKDIKSVIALKKYLTRRQWISMIESLLRIGSTSHILWLCKANEQIFKLLEQALTSDNLADTTIIKQKLGMEESFWRYGTKAAGPIKKAATDYLRARVGINVILHQLEDHFGPSEITGGLSNIDDIAKLLMWLNSDEVRSVFDVSKFRKTFQEVLEANPSVMQGKKGITSNICEFLRYVLGQRQTNETGLDSYDQGFFLAKRGNYKSAPWQVSLGPVSVMTLVHACTHDAIGPRTLNNFCYHLKQYGIEIDPDDVSNSSLGHIMRSLGLVLDSPDAEGGISLINPFDYVAD